MTWWALLYGLSMLARYHPADWMRALQVDKHSETVPLHAVLNVALVAVPHYVLDTLLGMPVLFQARPNMPIPRSTDPVPVTHRGRLKSP